MDIDPPSFAGAVTGSEGDSLRRRKENLTGDNTTTRTLTVAAYIHPRFRFSRLAPEAASPKAAL
jgi:hypothetical protein